MSDRLEAAIRELASALLDELRPDAETSGRPVELVSIEEAARRCSIGRTSMYRLVARGEVRSLKIGRRRLIAADAIAQFARDTA